MADERVFYVSYVVGDEELWVGPRASAVRARVIGSRPDGALPMVAAQAAFCALRLARLYRSSATVHEPGGERKVYRYRPGMDTVEASTG